MSSCWRKTVARPTACLHAGRRQIGRRGASFAATARRERHLHPVYDWQRCHRHAFGRKVRSRSAALDDDADHDVLDTCPTR